MLTIQPTLNRTCKYPQSNVAFKGDYADASFNMMNANEEDYDKEKGFWQEQKESFENLSNSDEVPSFVKKGMRVISVAVSAILGGMAMAWGSKKSIEAVNKLVKSEKVSNFNGKVKNIFASFKDAVAKSFKAFKASDFAQNISKKFKSGMEKINKSKFVQNVIVQDIIKGFNYLKGKTVDGYKFVASALKKIEIKPETVKKVVVNTLGVSGGVTSGLAAINETSKVSRGE